MVRRLDEAGGPAILVRRTGDSTHAARRRREARRSWLRLDELSGLLDARAPRARHQLAHRLRLTRSG